MLQIKNIYIGSREELIAHFNSFIKDRKNVPSVGDCFPMSDEVTVEKQIGAAKDNSYFVLFYLTCKKSSSDEIDLELLSDSVYIRNMETLRQSKEWIEGAKLFEEEARKRGINI